VGATGVAPRAGDPPLVDGAELAAHVDGGGWHNATAERARHRDLAQHAGGQHVPAEAGAGDAARDPRVGVRPHGAGEIVSLPPRPVPRHRRLTRLAPDPVTMFGDSNGSKNTSAAALGSNPTEPPFPNRELTLSIYLCDKAPRCGRVRQSGDENLARRLARAWLSWKARFGFSWTGYLCTVGLS